MFSFLRNHGVLGLNARNLLYVRPYNPRQAKAFADDKMKTKAYLSARGVPVAKVYARIETREQLQSFDFKSLPDQCVLKPNYGFGGEGIIILKGRRGGQFLENGKHPIDEQYLREHIEDILDGKFSVNGRPDTAFFEKILVPHESFAPFRPAGLPDIRIIVFNLVPVMAMLRIPTAESGGKANVHQGGIGIGIDMAKGTTTHACQYNRIIRQLPHGDSPSGIQIAYWEEMLLIASKIQQITNIGYLAVDLTIDADQGPVLLEVNARAGLMVQVANLAPLRTRLERVKGITVGSPDKGVRLAQDLFGEKTRRQQGVGEPERPRLGTHELVQIHCSAGSIEVLAAVAPSMTDRTLFSPSLVHRLLTEGGLEQQADGLYRVKLTLGGRKIQTMIQEAELPFMDNEAVIGRRDLTDFLIDPSKKSDTSAASSTGIRADLRAADRIIGQIDRDLLLLKHIKPINVREERERVVADPLYTPIFLYADIPGIDDMQRRLEALIIDDSPLGILLQKKRGELLCRIDLLRARGDAARFTEMSAALYGRPTVDLLSSARTFLATRAACELPVSGANLLSAEDAAEVFAAALDGYGLHDWQVSIRDTLVADCTVGWKRLYLRSGSTFTREHVESLVAHEIETHVLTLENGDRQPFDIFRRGFANYLDTQEGLAVFNQNRVLGPHSDKRYGPARSVLAVEYGLTHSFSDTLRYLREELGYTSAKAVTKAIELKRGLSNTADIGGFTKGIVYYRGFLAINEFVHQQGDLRRLYIGKIALEDLELAEQVPGVRPPLLTPQFLRPSLVKQEEAKGKTKKKREDELEDGGE